MKFAYVIAASLVAAATAEEFYWTKSNNFAALSNWAIDGVACSGDDKPGDCPQIDQNDMITFAGPLTIPDASTCDTGNNWAAEKGRVVKMDAVS